MRTVSFKADEEILRIIRVLVARYGWSASEVIRYALRRLYAEASPLCRPFVSRRVVIRDWSCPGRVRAQPVTG